MDSPRYGEYKFIVLFLYLKAKHELELFIYVAVKHNFIVAVSTFLLYSMGAFRPNTLVTLVNAPVHNE